MAWILALITSGLIYFLVYKAIFSFIASKNIILDSAKKRLIITVLIVLIFYPPLAYVEFMN